MSKAPAFETPASVASVLIAGMGVHHYREYVKPSSDKLLSFDKVSSSACSSSLSSSSVSETFLTTVLSFGLAKALSETW